MNDNEIDTAVLCPRCKGAGESFAHINRGSKPHTWEDIDCFYCKGSGLMPKEKLAWMEEGDKLRKVLTEQRKTLRELATEHGMRLGEIGEYIAGLAKMPDCLRALIQTTEKE